MSININKKILSVSLVMYCNCKDELTTAITCVLKSNLVGKLYLIDNSPTEALKFLKNIDPERIIYLYQNNNLGFGKAHNIAIKLTIKNRYKYHLVVNPDISFDGDIIRPMIEFMEKDNEIGMMMPQILNLDGSIQNLPKLLPSPKSILWRKIRKPNKAYQNFINKYELRNVPKDLIYNAPVLSGCFTILNIKAIEKVGMYDDNYFMYFEDWDLSRRMHKFYKTIYFPKVSVIHGYESGANKNKRLFKIYINSAITYFNKWNWFFDNERSKINKKTISEIKKWI
ncbi:glycosyltransferase family 2 protein [Polaribacter sp. Z022]|uniref:glycosyltransferase n=1 Tax=Polaribacter sp. Z022 TaxID=2927125 RepID=UPI002021D27B|nr:glycosyltransferase family 2 protein [Polaribacter sp. Z022]MCL7754808.1 glycosyltransferase family 2 protein [Polaribacter sp. Z022]